MRAAAMSWAKNSITPGATWLARNMDSACRFMAFCNSSEAARLIRTMAMITSR